MTRFTYFAKHNMHYKPTNDSNWQTKAERKSKSTNKNNNHWKVSRHAIEMYESVTHEINPGTRRRQNKNKSQTINWSN